MSQFTQQLLTNTKDYLLDVVTPDEDFSREDILKRKENRLTYNLGLDEILKE